MGVDNKNVKREKSEGDQKEIEDFPLRNYFFEFFRTYIFHTNRSENFNKAFQDYIRNLFYSLNEGLCYTLIGVILITWPVELILSSNNQTLILQSLYRLGVLLLSIVFLNLINNSITIRNHLIKVYLFTMSAGLAFSGFIIGLIPNGNHFFALSHIAAFGGVILPTSIGKRFLGTIYLASTYVIGFLYANEQLFSNWDKIGSNLLILSGVIIFSVIFGHIFHHTNREHFHVKRKLIDKQDQIERLTNRDQTTGLYNRKFLHKRLNEEFERVKNYSTDFSVVIIQTDKLKSDQVRFDFETKEKILRKLGQFIKDEIRKSDIACRTGDQEFIIVLPETSEREAKNFGNQIIDRIENHTFRLQPGKLLDLRCRLGLAEIDPDQNQPKELLNQAMNDIDEFK